MDKPSTSGGEKRRRKGRRSDRVKDAEESEARIRDEQEIVKLWRQMDEKLEDKAKAHNLTAINVKSLLHHLIKHPEVISKVMGLDEESTATNLKLTRSKVKQLRNSNEPTSSSAEKGVLVVPRVRRTFLDVDYENEDDDDDYNPEQTIEGNQEEEEEEEEEEVDETCNDVGEAADDGVDDLEEELMRIDDEVLEVERMSDAMTKREDEPIVRTRSRALNPDREFPSTSGLAPENDVLLYSAVDDPDYMAFISTLNDPELRFDFDEIDDPEYDFMADEVEDVTEKDELRMDRATEIPMREVEDLFQDLLVPQISAPSASTDMEAGKPETAEAKDVECRASIRSCQPVDSYRSNFPEFNDHIIALIGTTPDVYEKTCNSSSLIGASRKNPPRFSDFERQQLKAQMAKHVQLLTQFVVGCQFEPGLETARDTYQRMINSLYETREKAGPKSMFNIPNLDACIVSCHDIRSLKELTFERFDAEKDLVHYPLPQTMVALARSEALLFPDLMPEVRLCAFNSYYRYFTTQEEHLLALGVYEFSHVPHNNFQKPDGRNALIVEHYLPTKTVSQIKNHMKNFRSSPEPIYSFIARAEQGKVTLVFPPETFDGAQSRLPICWDQTLWPKWLKVFCNEINGAINAPTQKGCASFSTAGPYSAPRVCIISENDREDAESSAREQNTSPVVQAARSQPLNPLPLVFLVQAPSGVTLVPIAVKQLPVIVGSNCTLSDAQRSIVSVCPVAESVSAEQNSFIAANISSISHNTETDTSRLDLASSPEVMVLSDSNTSYTNKSRSSSRCAAKQCDNDSSFAEDVAPKVANFPSTSNAINKTLKELEPKVLPQTSTAPSKVKKLVDQKKTPSSRNEATVDLLKELEMSDSDASVIEHNLEEMLANIPPKCADGNVVETSLDHLDGHGDADDESSQKNILRENGVSKVAILRIDGQQRSCTISDDARAFPSCSKNDSSTEVLNDLILSSSDESTSKMANDSENWKSRKRRKKSFKTSESGLYKKESTTTSILKKGGSFKEGHWKSGLAKVSSEQPPKEVNEETGAGCANEQPALVDSFKSPHSDALVARKEMAYDKLRVYEEQWSNFSHADQAVSEREFVFPNHDLKKPVNFFGFTPLITPRLRSSCSDYPDCDEINHISFEVSQTGWSRDDFIPKTPCLHTPGGEESLTRHSMQGSSCKKSAVRNLFGATPNDLTTEEPCSGSAEDSANCESGALDSSCLDEEELVLVDAVGQDSSDESVLPKLDVELSIPNEHQPADTVTAEDNFDQHDEVVMTEDKADQHSDAVIGDENAENDPQPSCSKEKDEERSSDDEKNRNNLRRGKKRRKRDRLLTGLKGMLDESHREKQFKALSKVILGDFKQQMFMHQDKIRAVQNLINFEKPSPEMFEKLYHILTPEHSLLLMLLSMIFPESSLPENVFHSPLRKAFFAAVEMILNIEAYASFGKTKYSARSIFRSIRQLGPFCDCKDLEQRLAEMLSNEDPLWCALSVRLPSATCPPPTRDADYEFVDMENWKDSNAEYEDIDLAAALGPGRKRRQTCAHINNGRLLVEKNGRMCEAIAYTDSGEKPFFANAEKTLPKTTKDVKCSNKNSARGSSAKLQNSCRQSAGAKVDCSIGPKKNRPVTKSRKLEESVLVDLKQSSSPIEAHAEVTANSGHLCSSSEETIREDSLVQAKGVNDNKKMADSCFSSGSGADSGNTDMVLTVANLEAEGNGTDAVGKTENMELNGRMRTCNLVTEVPAASEEAQRPVTPISDTVLCGSTTDVKVQWSRANDKILLHSYNDCGGNLAETARLAGERLKVFGGAAIEQRLSYLLSFFK